MNQVSLRGTSILVVITWDLCALYGDAKQIIEAGRTMLAGVLKSAGPDGRKGVNQTKKAPLAEALVFHLTPLREKMVGRAGFEPA